MDKHDLIIQKLSEDVSYLRGRFDTAIPEMQESAKDIRKLLESQDKRIDVVEKDQAELKVKVVGIGSAISIFVTVGGNWILKHFA